MVDYMGYVVTRADAEEGERLGFSRICRLRGGEFVDSEEGEEGGFAEEGGSGSCGEGKHHLQTEEAEQKGRRRRRRGRATTAAATSEINEGQQYAAPIKVHGHGGGQQDVHYVGEQLNSSDQQWWGWISHIVRWSTAVLRSCVN